MKQWKKSSNNSGFMEPSFLKMQKMVKFCNCLLNFIGIKNSRNFTNTLSFVSQCIWLLKSLTFNSRLRECEI